MTQREIYTFGYATGYLVSLMQGDYDHSGFKFSQGARLPLTGFADAHNAAQRQRVLGEAESHKLAALLDHINDVEGGEEKCQPLEMQGVWQLGYYHAKSGKPYPDNEVDIAALRKLNGLTQKELADMIGCDQSMVSRLEAGKGTDELRAKALEILK